MRPINSSRAVYQLVLANTCALAMTLAASADLVLVDSLEAWLDQAGIVRCMPATAKNLALAQGISDPPTSGESLGTDTLVFAPTETNFGFTFTLTSLHYNWVFNAIAQSYTEPHLSPGTTSGEPDDDWKIEFGTGRAVYAFAFDLLDNAENGTETIEIYDTLGTLLNTFDTSAVAGTTSTIFVGIISSVPIGKIVYNEDAGGDDIGIAGFRFGTTETCAADLNVDGAVDGADLAILLGSWGICF